MIGGFLLAHLLVPSFLVMGDQPSLNLSVRSARAQDPKLTIEIRAMPLEKAAQELAQVIGKPITVSTRIKNYTTLVKVKDVPFSELREKFTTVFGVYWEKQKDGAWFIGKTQEQFKEEDDEEIRERTARIRAGLEKLKKFNRLQQPFTDKGARDLALKLQTLKSKGQENKNRFQEIRRFEELGPGYRLASKLISMFPAESLAWMPENKAVVFCNRPTAIQQRLPFDAQPSLDEFANEQNTWANAAKAYSFATEPGKPSIYLGQLGQQTAPSKSAPAIVMVRLFFRQSYQSLEAKIMVGGRDGKILHSVQLSQSLLKEQKLENRIATSLRTKNKISLSPEAHAYVEFTGLSKFEPAWKLSGNALTPEEQKLFLDPVKRDPLSFHTSEVIFQMAERTKKNMVAHVSDLFLATLSPEVLSFQFLDQLSNVEEIQNERWRLIRSTNRPRESRQFYDRGQLRKAMRLILEGLPTIESEAELSLIEPMSTRSALKPLEFIPQLMMTAFQTGMFSAARNDSFGLEFYGLLSPAERSKARSKSGITFGALNQQARSQLSEVIFHRDPDRISIDPSVYKDPSLNALAQEYSNSLISEPTWGFGNGLPGNAVLRIDDLDESIVRVNGGRNVVGSREFTIETLAHGVFMETRPDLFESVVDEPKIDLSKLQLRKRKTVRLSLRFSPLLTCSFDLKKSPPGDGKVYSFDSLPANLKKQYQEAYEESVKMSERPGN